MDRVFAWALRERPVVLDTELGVQAVLKDGRWAAEDRPVTFTP